MYSKLYKKSVQFGFDLHRCSASSFPRSVALLNLNKNALGTAAQQGLLPSNADPDFLKMYLLFTKRINLYYQRQKLCIIIQFLFQKSIFLFSIIHSQTMNYNVNSESFPLFLESYSHDLPSLEEIQESRGDIKKRSHGLLKSLIYPFDNTPFYYKNIMLEALHIYYIICSMCSYRWLHVTQLHSF